MILSKRERLIILVTAIVLALLALDRYAITPLLDYRAAIETQKQRAATEMQRATALMAHKRRIDPKWRETMAAGLKRDPAEAESQILHAVRDWSAETGLKLASLKPERLPGKKSLQEISFQAVGTGSMDAVARFLWRIETAEVPIRVKELQLGARKEGTDDLTLQLRLSTLYLPARRPASTEAQAPAPSAGGKE
jgi:Tfp pilus assembly protein PilO